MKKNARPALPSDYWKPTNAKEGQRRINAQLVNVDQMLIEIIRHLRAEIARCCAVSARSADFKKIDDMLNLASQTSGKVAHIEPPGCDPQYFPPPPPPPDTTPKMSE